MKLFYITVLVVTFNITTKDGTIVSREAFEHAPEFSDVAHHGNEGPAIKHTLGFKTSAKAVLVTAEISGYNQLGEPFTLQPEAFTGEFVIQKIAKKSNSGIFSCRCT